MFVVHGLPSLYSSVTSVCLPLLIEVGPSALRFPYRTLTWILLCPCAQDRPALMSFLTVIFLHRMASLLTETISSFKDSCEIPLFPSVLTGPHQLEEARKTNSPYFDLFIVWISSLTHKVVD